MTFVLYMPPAAALLAANYAVTTFCLWFGHWYAHRPGTSMRDHHVLSHHRLYPHSGRCRTARFRMARGKYDSNRALLPWLLIPLAIEGAVLPWPMALAGFIQIVVFTALQAWIHLQFHLERSVLGRWRWYLQARARHDLHHDLDCNYAVGDHLWDRVFGTFKEAGGGQPR